MYKGIYSSQGTRMVYILLLEPRGIFGGLKLQEKKYLKDLRPLNELQVSPATLSYLKDKRVGAREFTC